ncbi:MAG: hydrogenase maturation nickel metallochaperone HypA [Anaerolineales bacterium]|nr:hydrogenase maturation nickel metallochaperone HypA [Anaerolineales bacterium]
MHELAVTQSILDIALRHAQEADAKRITSINLVVGEFASIVDDSVQFYWDLLAEDTIAKGAQLRFERIVGEMTCTHCQNSFHPQELDFACPNCGSQFVQITKGDEFRVDSIDVE